MSYTGWTCLACGRPALPDRPCLACRSRSIWKEPKEPERKAIDRDERIAWEEAGPRRLGRPPKWLKALREAGAA